MASTATAAAVTGEDSEAGATHVMDSDVVALRVLDCVMPPVHELMAFFFVAAEMLPTVAGQASSAPHEP